MSVNRKKRKPSTRKKAIRKNEKPQSPYMYVRLLVKRGIYEVDQILNLDRNEALRMIEAEEAVHAPREQDDRDVAADHVAKEES